MPNPTYAFVLFVAGDGINTRRAKQNIENLCQTYLKHNYEIKIIDINTDFQSALSKGIMVTPTLLVFSSHGENMIIGDLSDTKTVLETLGIKG